MTYWRWIAALLLLASVSVFDIKERSLEAQFRDPRSLSSNQRVSTDLVGFGGFFNRPLVSLKRLPHEPNADARYERANKHRECSILGPLCLLPLGIKILLFTPLFPIGFLLCRDGLSLANHRNMSTATAFKGIFMLLLGGVLAAIGLMGFIE